MKQSDETDVLAAFPKEDFQQALLTWYEANKRDLPWRKDSDPYKIWVSEIMLQQTQVETVIPYFHAFLSQFPTLQDLAEADEADVLKAWEGLGYYSRARHLQTGVREVCESYAGRVPDDKKAVASLKGVGPYTAGAILSIAYGQPEPAVDGNVMRVFSRLLHIEDDISKAKTRKRFEKIVRALIPEGATSAFNQGLMELGATVCTPKTPHCLLCPVQSYCEAYRQGVEADLPVKQKKKAAKVVPLAVVVVQNQQGEVLIRRRPEQGLLAGLWEFPSIEWTEKSMDQDRLRTAFYQTYHYDIAVGETLLQLQHAFTHLKWELTVFKGTLLSEDVEESENFKFVSAATLADYAFPTSQQKIINAWLHHV